jgi:hypothetical protein
MRQVFIDFFLLSFTLGIAAVPGASAQTFGSAPYPDGRARAEEIYSELLWSGAVQSQTATQTQIAKRTDAQYREQQLLLRAERLVQLWSALAREYNEKGGFNVKTAREVSKAFHDLEKTEGWPK